LKDINFDLLHSSTLLEGVNTLDDFNAWLSKRMELGKFKVEKTPLKKLDGWSFNKNTGSFGHKSGKFFTVRGLNVEREINGINKHWTQIIVDQAEEGILGLLAKKINGIIHVLIQAKMEPGNIGFIQISPTVQSTKSNYTRVHGGKKTKYIDYFLNRTSGMTIFNQLRSEQGSRYFRKRNQNIVVLVEENHQVPEDENFFWLTLGQLRELHKIPNLVHLDCRSIIGGMPFSIPFEFNPSQKMQKGNEVNLLSLNCDESNSLMSQRDLQSWFTSEKMKNTKNTKLVSIYNAKNWTYDGDSIKHDSGKFFDIIGVNVYSPGREVTSWSQPLIKCAEGGILGLIAQVHNGVLHFLIHARFEAGFIDSVELAPTVQFTPQNYKDPSKSRAHELIDYFQKDTNNEMLVDTFLSNEGGRFYKSENHHMVVKIPESKNISVPESYSWMTLSQLHYFGSMELTLNVELRSLLFCLTLT
jgi:dTDP-4-dehydro-6-deoxy-alpha-D-glucopyranose 2,3-dehydratase